MKKVAVIWFFLVASFFLRGQDIHFSQISHSSFFLNPSLISFQPNDYHATLHSRSQWQSVTKPFKTTVLSFERKDFFPSHSFGIQFLNDFSGDSKFKTTGLNIVYSKFFRIVENNSLSFAFSGGFFERSVSYEDLIFNDIEQRPNINFWFSDITLGITNEHKINKKTIMKNSIALFHVNKPKQSLTGNNELHLTPKTNVYCSILYLMNQEINFSPKFLYSTQDKTKEIVFLFDAAYKIKNKYLSVLKIGTGYRIQDAIIFSFGSQIGNFNFTASYDFNTSSFTPATNYKGGTEFVISYAWNIKQKRKTIKKEECPKYL